MKNPAETYEREMVPTLFEPWAKLLIEMARPQPGESVLDLACGTGIVARRVAPHISANGQVMGMDLSPHMLAVAMSRAMSEGHSIEWREGRAETMPFPDDSFDLVLCQQGMQFFTEKQQALAEIRRILRTGGRVVGSLWRGLDHHPFFAKMNDVMARHIGVPALAAPFVMNDETELHTLLADAGFSEIAVSSHSLTARFPDPDDFVAMEMDVIAAAIPSMQHLDEQARSDMAQTITGEAAELIREYTRDGQLAIPMHSFIAVAINP